MSPSFLAWAQPGRRPDYLCRYPARRRPNPRLDPLSSHRSRDARETPIAGAVEPAARLPGTLLGELLVRRGELNEVQLASVLQEQAHTKARLGELLLARRIVPPSAIARALAEQ